MKVNIFCMLFLKKCYKVYLELCCSVSLDFTRCTWVGCWLLIDGAGHIICPILNGKAVLEHTWNT